jgi:SAM-dependent methyltransferase
MMATRTCSPWARLAAAAAWLVASMGGARAAEEVPFITTPDRVALAMLEIAKVGPNDHVIDLGSGDGRIVILAAKLFGARGLGVEIVPDLVQRSRVNAKAVGVQDRVEFREQDLFKTDLSAASVITMYLLPDVNLQLRPLLLSLEPGTRIVSHDWDMGDWPPERTLTIPVPDKAVGLDKFSRVHLWVVPARVHGLWCGEGRVRGGALRFTQEFQRFTARLGGVPDIEGFEGRIEGATLHAKGLGGGEIRFELRGDKLYVPQAASPLSRLDNVVFARTRLPGCERKP